MEAPKGAFTSRSRVGRMRADDRQGRGAAGGILAILVQAIKRFRAEVSRLSDRPAARVTPVFNR